MKARLVYASLSYLFLLSNFSLDTFPANAQSVSFERLITPSIPIIDFVQDDEGFLWMVGHGLHRFDGFGFTSYFHDPNDSTSLSTNRVSSLLVSSDGILWIGTSGPDGLLHEFDPETKSFLRYRLQPGSELDRQGTDIFQLFEDHEGFLWISTNQGELFRFDRENETFVAFVEASERGGIIADMLEDDNGAFWFIVGDYDPAPGGLYKMDRVTGIATEVQILSETGGDPLSFDALSIHQDGDGIFWIGAWPHGLIRYNPQTNQSKIFEAPEAENTRLWDIQEDQRGNLWLAFWSLGLMRFDRETETYTQYFNRQEHLAKEGANTAFRIFEDRQGTLWISYTGNQIMPGATYKIVQSPGEFTYFDHDPENPKSLSRHRQVYAINEDSEGAIWVGMFRGGVNRFDPQDHTFTRFLRNPGNPDDLASGSVMSIVEDTTGALWMGSFFPGLHRYDKENGSFTHTQYHLDQANGLVRNGVIDVYNDASGALWLGTWNDGLIRFDPNSGDTRHYRHIPGDTTSLIGDIVPYVGEDRNGNLWVSAYNQAVIARRGALHRFERETDAFERYDFGASYPFEDSSGRFWVLSADRGLIQWSRDTGMQKFYTMENGLPSNHIFCMLEDDSGKLWFSSSAGISRLDPQTDVIQHFDNEGELTEAPFSEGSNTCYRAEDGTFYFGRYPGLTTFNPGEFVFNTVPPGVAITEIRAGDEVVPTHDPSFSPSANDISREIELNYFQNNLSIQYIGLHYENPSRNTYRYKLEAFNETWIDAGTERWARFFQVPPGDYTFRVQAANPNGIWNETGTSVSISILPPWWRTRWAYGLYALMLFGSLIAANRIQRQRLIRREREQARIDIAQLEARSAAERAQMAEHLEEVKSRFFINLSHEFRTPLTLILGPLRDVLGGAFGAIESQLHRQLQVMQRNGDRLLRLINELLDLSKMEVEGFHLQAHQSDLVAFARALTQSFTSLAEREEKVLQFDTDTPDLYVFFDRAKLEKVISNLLSNAFKFTSSGDVIRVSVDTIDSVARIQVHDNGRGIPASELTSIFERFYQVEESSRPTYAGTGIGLALAKQLVELHSGTIEVESNEGKGSTFTVKLQLGRDHLRDEDLVTEDADNTQYFNENDESYTIAIENVRAPELAESATETATILIVEDNPDLREYLKSLLRGYQVVEATNGEDGLHKALEILPDLVISDVMMPVMDGMALCEALRKNKKTQDVPVILLTAKATEAHKIEGLLAGADEYLYKPFSARELVVRAENLIDLRHRLQSQYRSEVVLRPARIVVTSADAAFVEKVRSVVDENLGDSWFGVERLADEVGLSRRQLQRKMNTLLQKTASTFIRDMRLERALVLLRNKAGNVSEISYSVGYNDPQHFSELFRKKYGYLPSDAKATQTNR